MNFRKSILLSLAVVAFAAPGISSATSSWHDTRGDSGGDLEQAPFKGTKTRAQVMQELEVARQDGSLPTGTELNRNYPVNKKAVGSGKTRAAVQNELLTLSAEDTRRVSESYRGR